MSSPSLPAPSSRWRIRWGALAKLLLSLLSFTEVALGGLLLLAFGLYPLLLGLATRQWQYAGFFRRIFPAQSMAFSSSSSAATLPMTLKCVTEELKAPPAIANFVLPIGSTVNMDGTSLYQTVCIIFLAQWHGKYIQEIVPGNRKYTPYLIFFQTVCIMELITSLII